ncbi:aminotransferase class I/II-fold pyridoxal phosphate-dependent enzyme [Olivibacter sp. CPCC 100613]|uniref:pyridoxal phosphate-dependent aminotransferase n=1 Tax=Olivibacter sp. CPCC 100613 TaxID=3079931 RepID=UPI002FF913C5
MFIEVAKRLQHTEEYYFSKKLREIDELNKNGAKVINLGIGSPDLPPHPTVIETLSNYASLPNTHAYQSYKGVPALRSAIASWYDKYYQVKLNPDTEVLPLIGSKEGIMHICMTYLQEGDEALIPNPGYPTYSSAVRLTGAKGVYYGLQEANGWLPDLEALAKQDLSKVKLMWVNYPHMPTGAKADKAFFKDLITFAKTHRILLCHDNPYSFILTEQPTSLMSIEGAKDVALELNSLSKSSNMAGWRVGMLVGHHDRINEIMRFKSNMDSGMFLPLQMAATAALALDEEWYAKLNKIYRGRRQKVYELLQTLHCDFDESQVGLFVWAKVPTSYKDGYELSDEVLKRAAVFITPGGIFGSAGQQYVRVSLCTTEAVLQEAIDRIKAKK